METLATLPAISLTNSIYLIHEDDTRLMISGIIEHLSDQSSTFTNVLVHYRTRHHLLKDTGVKRLERKQIKHVFECKSKTTLPLGSCNQAG